MKRDMTVIRRILFEIEKSDSQDIYFHTPECHQLVLMADAGLVVGREQRTDSHGVVGFTVERLSDKGHDLIDVFRSETIWKKAQDTILKPMGGVAFDVLIAWGKEQMALKLGLSAGKE